MANMAPDIPPELAAMLGGASLAGPPNPDPAQASAGQGGGPSPAQAVQDAIAAVDVARQVEQDDEDLAVLMQCMTALQKLLAKNQQQEDQAMGVGPAQKAMRRSVNQGGGSAY